MKNPFRKLTVLEMAQKDLSEAERKLHEHTQQTAYHEKLAAFYEAELNRLVQFINTKKPVTYPVLEEAVVAKPAKRSASRAAATTAMGN